MVASLKMPDNDFILALADALYMPLRLSPMGVLVGSVDKVLTLGGFFRLKVTWTARVDEQGEDMLSAYVHLAGDLWGYIVLRHGGVGKHRMWLYFIDGGDKGAKLTVAGLPDTCKGSAREAVKALSPYVLGPVLEYDIKSNHWQVSAPKEPAPDPAPSPA